MTKAKKNHQPKIEYEIITLPVSELIPWEKNPRFISDFMYKKLLNSIEDNGIFELPIVNRDKTIIGGHQRKEAFLELGIQQVQCLMPKKELSEKQFIKINLASNKISGSWDDDALANYIPPELMQDVGFTPEEMGGFDPNEEEPKEKEFDESIIDGEEILVSFKVKIPNAEAASFENQLDDLLAKFPTAKKESKI